MLRIKVCGITRKIDAEKAVELGADALGFIFYPHSPRFIEPAVAAEIAAELPQPISRVAVCVNPDVAQIAGIRKDFLFDVLQIHGLITWEYLEAICQAFCLRNHNPLSGIHSDEKQEDDGFRLKDCRNDGVVVHGNSDKKSAVKRTSNPTEKDSYRMTNKGADGDFVIVPAIQVGDDFSVDKIETLKTKFSAVLFDTYNKKQYGGTGHTFNWKLIKDLNEDTRIILAGGLNPENITKAVETVKPYAVDLNSGVESSPGIKDHEKLQDIFHKLKETRRDWQPDPPKAYPLA